MKNIEFNSDTAMPDNHKFKWVFLTVLAIAFIGIAIICKIGCQSKVIDASPAGKIDSLNSVINHARDSINVSTGKILIYEDSNKKLTQLRQVTTDKINEVHDKITKEVADVDHFSNDSIAGFFTARYR